MRELKSWVANCIGKEVDITPLHGDASFRSYYRAKSAELSFIVMLAPPEKERTDIFVTLAQNWQQFGLPVPKVLHWEPRQGYVLLTDFGDVLLLDELNVHAVDHYYEEAMKLLLHLQQVPDGNYVLPCFDEAHIRIELSYFQEWFLSKLLKQDMTNMKVHLLESVFSPIVESLLAQPQVPIHRDYHSRNIMVLPEKRLGLIDFQDAMRGPITYDLVSLLKDCYISWEDEKINGWVRKFYEMQKENGNLERVDLARFKQWFDWVGLQRHLKVLGIFLRLKLRDNKPQYLNDIPRVMNYVLQVTSHYPQFTLFDTYLRQEVLPCFAKASAVAKAMTDKTQGRPGNTENSSEKVL